MLAPDAREYAVNASNARHWGPGIRAYVSDLVNGALGPRDRDFNMRWLASLVAETYRILMRGGIFLYPADERPAYREGRIRLVYEANPIAFLCEQAGGSATDGSRPRSSTVGPTTCTSGPRSSSARATRSTACAGTSVDPPTVHERVTAVLAARALPQLRRSPCRIASSDHRRHRFVRRRDDHGQEHLRPDLPARGRPRRPHRGRRLPSLRPRRHGARRWPRPPSEGNNHFSHFGPEANLLDELDEVFREFAENGTGRTRHYVHDEHEAAAARRARRARSPSGSRSTRRRPALLRGPARRGRHRRRRPVAARRPQDRRRAGDQPRVDPEAASRQAAAAATRRRPSPTRSCGACPTT